MRTVPDISDGDAEKTVSHHSGNPGKPIAMHKICDVVHTRAWRRKLKRPFSSSFFVPLLSGVLRVRGRFQNLRQTPVRTKLRLKRFLMYLLRKIAPRVGSSRQMSLLIVSFSVMKLVKF